VFTFPFDTSIVRWVDFHVTGHIVDYSSVDSIAFMHYLSDCLGLHKLTHLLSCYLKPLFDFYQYVPEHEHLIWVNYCRTKTIRHQPWVESPADEKDSNLIESFQQLQKMVVDLKPSVGNSMGEDKIKTVKGSDYFKKLSSAIRDLKSVSSLKSNYLTTMTNAAVVMKWLNQLLTSKQITERSLQFLDTSNWKNGPDVQFTESAELQFDEKTAESAEPAEPADGKVSDEEVEDLQDVEVDEEFEDSEDHKEISVSIRENSSNAIPFENLSGFKISKLQWENLQHAIDQHNSRKKSQMIQFDMGAGKSSIILPLLVLHIFQNIRPPTPNHVRHVFLIQPDHLIPSMVKRIVTTVLPLLPNVRLFHVLHPESSFKEMIQQFQSSSSISIITDVEWKQFCLQLILRNQSTLLTRENVSVSLLFDEFDSMAVPSISSFNWTSQSIPHPLYRETTTPWYQMYTDSILKLFDQSGQGQEQEQVQDRNDFQSYLRRHFDSLATLRTNIDFGFHPTEPFAGAIPFAKANQPRVGSNFSDPDVRAILTARLYDIYSIPDTELDQLRMDWMVVKPADIIHHPILKAIEILYKAKEIPVELTSMSIETRDKFLFESEIDWWRHHAYVKRAMLTTKIMPNIVQINPFKYTFSFLDGLQPFFQKHFNMVAFSGTGFLMELFESRSGSPQVSFKANAELTTDQQSILRNAMYKIVPSRPTSDTLQLWFNAVTIRDMLSRFQVNKTEKMVVCVIDAAGWACHLSIDEWVDKFKEVVLKGKQDLIILSKIHGKHFLQFTYWDEHHQMKCVLFDTHSEQQIFKQCTLTQGTRADTMYFVLFDQQHTVGTDISLPSFAVGFVSLDNNSTLSMTGQAVKRMRHLNAKNSNTILTVIASTNSASTSDEIMDLLVKHERSLLQQNQIIFDRLLQDWTKRIRKQVKIDALWRQKKTVKNYHPSDEYLVMYEYPFFSGKNFDLPECGVNQEQQQGAEQSINVDEEKEMVDELFGIINQVRDEPKIQIHGLIWKGENTWTNRESIRTLLRMYPKFCPIISDDETNVTWQLPSDDIITFPFFGREKIGLVQIKEYTRLLFLLSQWVTLTLPSIDTESTLYEKLQQQLLYMYPRHCLFWISHFFKQLKIQTTEEKSPTSPEFRANLLRQDLYPWHKPIKIMVEMEKIENLLEKPPNDYGKQYLMEMMAYVWMWGRSQKYSAKQTALQNAWKARLIEANRMDKLVKMSIWSEEKYDVSVEITRYENVFEPIFSEKLELGKHDKENFVYMKNNDIVWRVYPDKIKAEARAKLSILINQAINKYYHSIFVHIPDLK